MITDIALRSHRRTSVKIDRSIYAPREVRGKLGRVLDRNYDRWWNDGCRGVQCDCEFRVSLAKPQNAPADMVCRVGLSAPLSRSAARTYSLSRHRYDILALSLAIVRASFRERHATLFRASIESPALARRYTSIDYTTITRNRGPCNNVTFASVFT